MQELKFPVNKTSVILCSTLEKILWAARFQYPTFKFQQFVETFSVSEIW